MKWLVDYKNSCQFIFGQSISWFSSKTEWRTFIMSQWSTEWTEEVKPAKVQHMSFVKFPQEPTVLKTIRNHYVGQFILYEQQSLDETLLWVAAARQEVMASAVKHKHFTEAQRKRYKMYWCPQSVVLSSTCCGTLSAAPSDSQCFSYCSCQWDIYFLCGFSWIILFLIPTFLIQLCAAIGRQLSWLFPCGSKKFPEQTHEKYYKHLPSPGNVLFHILLVTTSFLGLWTPPSPVPGPLCSLRVSLRAWE